MTALFWTIAGLLAAAVIAVMLRPLLSRRTYDGVSSDAMNTSLYAEQLAEQRADWGRFVAALAQVAGVKYA